MNSIRACVRGAIYSEIIYPYLFNGRGNGKFPLPLF